MQAPTNPQLSDLERVAALPGEPRNVSAAGVTRTAQRIITLENDSPFDPSAGSRRRLVIVADNDRAARATLAAIRWFKTDAPRSIRDRWNVSAVMLSYASDATPAQQLEFPPAKGFFDHPEQPESRYLWRWVAYQAPDSCCRFEAETCSLAAVRPPVHWLRRWRVGRRWAPCRLSLDRRAKQRVPRFSSTR